MKTTMNVMKDTARAPRRPQAHGKTRVPGALMNDYSNYLKPANKTIILSDVDGTLTRGSLVLDHATMLHNEGIIDLGDLPRRWAENPKDETIISALAEAYRYAIAGRKASDLRVKEFIASVVNDPARLYSSVERLKSHRAAGHEVVLISGSPTYLLRPFAKHFGFQSIGSLYHTTRSREFTGRITPMFGASEKTIAVSKIDLSNYKTVIGYGDTASDAPLLAVANYSVLVAPNERTLKNLEGMQISEIMLA